jgi:hypothetical protein
MDECWKLVVILGCSMTTCVRNLAVLPAPLEAIWMLSKAADKGVFSNIIYNSETVKTIQSEWLAEL